jgi:hypothetical protein
VSRLLHSVHGGTAKYAPRDLADVDQLMSVKNLEEFPAMSLATGCRINPGNGLK